MKVVILGLGGMGVNRIIDWCNAGMRESMPNVELIAIDGTDANTIHAPEDFSDIFWRVPGLDGGGAERGRYGKEYIQYVTDNYNRIPDAQLYILNFSLTGGSGNVLANEILRRMLKDGRCAICNTLITDESGKAIENSLKVLNGFAGLVRKYKRPVHLMIEDTRENQPSKIDAILNDNIYQTAIIAGVDHQGLDSNDIISFLDYQRHGIAPGLTLIQRHNDVSELNAAKGRVLTTLSFLTSQDNPLPKVNAAFAKYAITSVDEDIHYSTTQTQFDKLHAYLVETDNEYKAIAQEVVAKESFKAPVNEDDDEDANIIF